MDIHPLFQVIHQGFCIGGGAFADDVRNDELALSIHCQKQVLVATKPVVRDVVALFASDKINASDLIVTGNALRLLRWRQL